jgi:hypothetical protein
MLIGILFFVNGLIFLFVKGSPTQSAERKRARMIGWLLLFAGVALIFRAVLNS